MGYLTNTNRQPIKKRPSFKKVAAVLVISSALIGGIIWLAQVFQERQTFRKNEQVITGLSNDITSRMNNIKTYEGNECTIVHLKYRNGPKSCHITQYFLVESKNLSEAKITIEKINNIVLNKIELARIYQDDNEASSRWTYKFDSNNQDCYVDYILIKPGHSDDISVSLYHGLPKSYTGMVAHIGCSARAKWSYYPMRP